MHQDAALSQPNRATQSSADTPASAGVDLHLDWIGALVALAGALMALWPSAEARRRAQAAYAARLGKELGAAAGAGSRR